MMVSPHMDGDEANALKLLNSGRKRVAIGLHVMLTGPFRPMSNNFTPVRDGRFPTINEMGRLAMTRRLQPDILSIEIATQLQAFIAAFGHLPDFVDGHQHVHLLPQIRDAFLHVVAEIVPSAWVRQCGRAANASRLRDPKALILDLLSLGFRNQAERLGLATNPAFAGTYNFTPRAEFAQLFPRFLKGMPDGGLIMCHPGFVDAALEKLDSLTTLREHEFSFLSSDAFPRVLVEYGFALARPSGD
jgi:predicted glycoside hydrolase/deacetylase ChbG (UPF0249 family)